MRYISLLATLVILASLVSCGGKDEPTPDPEVLGCTDPNSLNFNINATKDDGSCLYDVLGCTDPTASNYNPDATKDDGSCTYDSLGCTDPEAYNYNPNATKDDGSCAYGVPTAFTQKVLVEEVSGAWCGWCPDGLYFFELLKDVYPNNVILLSEHGGDDMELPNYDNGIDAQYYPSAMINRIPWDGNEDLYLSRSSWGSSTQAIINQGKASIGLAIDTEFDAQTLKVTAHIGFGADQSNSYRLYIMLLEDKVTGSGSGYDQANYTNNTQGSPFFGLGDPIVGYEHPDVLRAYAQDMNGIEVDAASVKAGGQFSYEATFDVTAFNNENLKVVAFVTEFHNTVADSPVINAQQVIAGQNKSWDWEE